MGAIPTIYRGKMSVEVKLDSKGRVRIPSEFREALGDMGTVSIRKVREGLLIAPGRPQNFLEEFRKVIMSEPPRVGIPENWPPERIKAIWRTA